MSGKMLRQIPVDASMQSVAINGYELGGQTLYDSRVFSAPPYTSAVLSPEPDITPADAACIPQPGQSCVILQKQTYKTLLICRNHYYSLCCS